MRFEINEKCVACLACVRACPSQAIAVDGETVSIVDEACIRIGACVPACPHDAIDAVGDLERAIGFARGGEAVLVLSVEADVHFHPYAPEQVVNACYEAGFRTVHRGVLGDELVAQEYAALMADPAWGTLIRSTCPVIVEQIRHEYPELVPYLAPVATPLAAEAAYIRAEQGDASVVYAGVCISEGNGIVDATVTFEELDRLFERAGRQDRGAGSVFRPNTRGSPAAFEYLGWDAPTGAHGRDAGEPSVSEGAGAALARRAGAGGFGRQGRPRVRRYPSVRRMSGPPAPGSA